MEDQEDRNTGEQSAEGGSDDVGDDFFVDVDMHDS
jgi:SIT4-associating protein SAP185/190